MVRLLVGAVLASLVLFGWGFLFWVTSPLRYTVLKTIPNDEKVVSVLQENLRESGVYLSPFEDESRFNEDRKTAEKELLEKHRKGPLVEVIYRKDGVDPMSPAL